MSSSKRAHSAKHLAAKELGQRAKFGELRDFHAIQVYETIGFA
jgi:hypothetical protein